MKKLLAQVFGGGSSDRLDVLENGASRDIGDLCRVGVNPGVIDARTRGSRRSKYIREQYPHVSLPFWLTSCYVSRVRRSTTCSRK